MSKNKFGQFFNFQGVLFNLKYIFGGRKISPDIRVRDLAEIDLLQLKNVFGVKFIVFDKDNTLTLPHKNQYANDRIKDKVLIFINIFGQENLAILSNSAGSRDDLNFKEGEEIELNTGLKVIKHEFKKPKVFVEILETFKLLGDYDKSGKINYEHNKQICIIGDRLLVDVSMGKEYGFCTILVEPISAEKDNFMVKLMRKFENYLLTQNTI